MCPFICNSVKQLNFEALQCAVLCLTKSLEWSIIFSLRHAPQLFRGGRTSSLTCKMFLCAQSTQSYWEKRCWKATTRCTLLSLFGVMMRVYCLEWHIQKTNMWFPLVRQKIKFKKRERRERGHGRKSGRGDEWRQRGEEVEDHRKRSYRDERGRFTLALIQIQRKGCTFILPPNLVDGGTVAPAYTTSDSGSTLANHHVMFKSNHASVSGLALSMKAVRFSCGLFHTYGYTCL